MFGGFSRSLRGPNLGMVVRGLVSSPLLHGAAAGRLSLTAALSLSTTDDQLGISPRCAGPDLLYRLAAGYISLRPEPGIAELLSLNSDRAYV